MAATDPAQSAPVEPEGDANKGVPATERASSFAEMVGANRRRLVQLAYRFCWNRSDAEDAVQNALVLARNKGSQLRSGAKWWSWVCRIVVRQCLLLRRTEGRHAKHRTAFATEIVAPIAASPTDAIERSERAALVRWAIERLPQQQRIAVTLRHLEEMSYERIAEIMQITPGTARVHLRAAREAMRQAIVKRAPEFGRRRRGK